MVGFKNKALAINGTGLLLLDPRKVKLKKFESCAIFIWFEQSLQHHEMYFKVLLKTLKFFRHIF